jgi:spermidine/putrescine transport system permease protein
MQGRFRAYSASIEEAAYDLGATDWQVFSKIALPIAFPGIMSCFILSFTTSFDEFVVSYFLVGAQQTLPLFIWTNLRFVDQLPKILALGTIILFVSTLLVVWAEFLQRRELSSTQRNQT